MREKIKNVLLSAFDTGRRKNRSKDLKQLVDELSEDYFQGFLSQSPTPCSTEMRVNKIEDYEQQIEIRSGYGKH